MGLWGLGSRVEVPSAGRRGAPGTHSLVAYAGWRAVGHAEARRPGADSRHLAL